MTTTRRPRDNRPDPRIRSWVAMLEANPDEELPVLLLRHWNAWAGWNWEGSHDDAH